MKSMKILDPNQESDLFRAAAAIVYQSQSICVACSSAPSSGPSPALKGQLAFANVSEFLPGVLSGANRPAIQTAWLRRTGREAGLRVSARALLLVWLWAQAEGVWRCLLQLTAP